MKIINERETQKQQEKQRQKRAKGGRSYSESVRAEWFCCAFKLGFLQLISKGSLIFKSNLKLALSNMLKQNCMSQNTYYHIFLFHLLFSLSLR